MSTGRVSSHRSKSSHSKLARNANAIPPPPTLTPENVDREFEPCAATASYLLYAQRNLVLCLHHDTLAIERRFDRHREDVRWIAADTVSERGAGRLAVSYDAGHTAIVWDIATGDEIARFAAYEEIRVATWMRNGNIAFGNVQGNVILFEPSTSEHISARTIYDPITAIAPVADNRTFAIGYFNGSILIATLQPFTMVHSLNTSNAPSRVTGLAWHGSATRQKSDMLATQTADGNLKVWSIPKVPNGDAPNIIRILNRPDGTENGPCWFAWSKLGRIIQHSGGETRSWDVRTKNVTYETVPTLDGIVGIANCGPTSTLFTLGSNHTVQQYDVRPGEQPLQVAKAQHAPANTPPSPPNSIEEQKDQGPEAIATLPTLASIPIVYSDVDISEGEATTMSPLQRIAKEMDQLEEERRDRVGPLSPVSSRASSVSSNRSSEGGHRAPSYRYDKPFSSRASNASGNEGTEFSFGQPMRQPVRESISVQSTTSFASSKYRSSGLRKEVLRSPNEGQQGQFLDLFPLIKSRLAHVPFRTPYYGHSARTPDVLRREMLSVVFGWNDDIELLIRDEMTQHIPASTSRILLAQWLGDLGADSMASMVGSESMTSADWMLLALSTMGHGSQKKVGEAFVHRLLEKGDIHPAVAILLGLHDENDAIEVYISRDYYMEAVLLTCLVFPSDWQRQSYLVRKWGEILMAQGQPELAVRCFSCTSVDTSEPCFSPRVQDSAYATRHEQHSGRPIMSPPLSPPSATESGRVKRNASLKLITSFGEKGIPLLGPPTQITPMGNLGVTPIAESALSPSGAGPWLGSSHGKERDPSSARTATPGGYSRKRLPSRSDRQRAPFETPRTAARETPLTAARDLKLPTTMPDSVGQTLSGHGRRTSSISSSGRSQVQGFPSPHSNVRKVSEPDRLPSPAQNVFARLKEEPKARNGSRERLPVTLQVQVYDAAYLSHAGSPSQSSDSNASSHKGQSRDAGGAYDGRSVQVEHRTRERGQSRQREASESRGRPGMRYIVPAKQSPSSPIPMSPEEVAAATRAMAKQNAERAATEKATTLEPNSARASSRARSRAASRQRKPESKDTRIDARGNSQQRNASSLEHSPSSPRSASQEAVLRSGDDTRSGGQQVKSRKRSVSRSTHEQTASNDVTSPIRSRGRADSRARPPVETVPEITDDMLEEAQPGKTRITGRDQLTLVRKQLAARELEERRQSLARRPSAPVIPLPGESPSKRPPMAPRYHTELGDAPNSFLPPMSGHGHERSHTVDPHEMMRLAPKMSGVPGPSAPIGLPATPRAMRHPYYMGTDFRNESMPALPDVPDHLLQINSHESEADADNITPLLPSSVFSFKEAFSPQRAASVPLERTERGAGAAVQYPAFKATSPALADKTASTSRGHVRRASQPENQAINKRFSPPPVRASIDETLHDAQVVVVEATDSDQCILPELMHLATPPPPPPPPPMFSSTPSTSSSNLGVINIAIDEGAPMVIDVAPTGNRAATTSPTATMNSHRRGRNSMSEGISQRLRNVAGMRSTSRSRAKSPSEQPYKAMPYETVLGGPQVSARRESLSRTKSPYEPSLGGGTPVPDLAKVADGSSSSLPPSRAGSAFQQGQRQQREIRANMPPDMSETLLQQGVYRPDNMI